MTVGTIIALIVAIPLMLIPVVFVWYINIGGIMLALKEAREKKAVEEKGARVAVRTK